MEALPSAYQPADGTILEWRIYRPGWTYASSPPPSPTPYIPPGPGVIVEHGGNWNVGSPFDPDIERVSQALAQSGFWVFCPSYRLAPCGRITGQPGHGTTTLTGGRPPEQTDDLMFAVMAARNSSHCSGHKVGILGSSVGGFLAAYVALYRHNITGTGRPQWHGGVDDSVDYRPACIATFSSPFDLGDQRPDDPTLFGLYIRSLQNYVGCSLTAARDASPISLINGADTANNFKPMFIVQADNNDDTNPPRQLDDMTIALNAAAVDPCLYPVKHVTSDTSTGGHALILWPQPDPNPDPGHEDDSIGDSALRFFHQYLDD